MTNKKSEILGMPFGTASGRLRKQIMFNLAIKANEHYCFHCSKEIELLEEFSIEHKQSWQNTEDPIGLFFDMDNIAFSHLQCNIRASVKPKKYFTLEEKAEAQREYDRRSKRKNYSKEKRAIKYKSKGY